MTKKIPKSLKLWFLIHFIVDVVFAVPLLFFPEWVLKVMGLVIVESITARLVGAALLGIGGAIYFARKKTFEAYEVLLSFKIIWALGAIVGLAIELYKGAESSLWVILGVFAIFATVWIYFKVKLR